MNDELRRAMARAFAFRPEGAHEMPRRCSYCKRLVESKDFISSFRLQPDGEYVTVQLCRTCRDSGI